jgi:hypothetical protein
MENQNTQNTQNNQNTYCPYDKSHPQYIQAFNEGYSKACFDIGFSQGYNSGYNVGHQTIVNQEYWNNQIQTEDTGVNTELNSQIQPQPQPQPQPPQPQTCDEHFDSEGWDEHFESEGWDEHFESEGWGPGAGDEHFESEGWDEHFESEGCDEHFESEGCDEQQVFDDNMEIEFEWQSQDTDSNPFYTPLYDSNSTIWNVIKTDVSNDLDENKDIDVNALFYPNDPISWNVIKEEPELVVNTEYDFFDNKYVEDPFCDYKLDSQIFSSFSWGDILTQNANIDMFKNNKVDSISITSNLPTFPVIQEDEETEDEETEDEETEDEETKENNSWVYISETKEKKISTDIDSYSFNFDSFTSEDEDIKPKTDSDYTLINCDEISLDSSISSESVAEGDMNIVSVSMPSLPSLQISFDDRNEFTYYNEMYYNPYEEIYCNPASQLPNSCPPLSPIQRATSKK